MLPLPRVGGALSGALEGSIAGTGARVNRALQWWRSRLTRLTTTDERGLLDFGIAKRSCVLSTANTVGGMQSSRDREAPSVPVEG